MLIKITVFFLFPSIKMRDGSCCVENYFPVEMLAVRELKQN